MDQRVYLSGKMGGLIVGDVLSSRAEAKYHCDRFGLGYYDPADSEGLERLDPAAKIDLSIDYVTMSGFVRKDETNLDKCTVCLVLTGDTPSDGTWWEMARAYYYLKIPIVMVAPKRLHETLMGFSNVKLNYFFETTEAAIVFIKHGLPKEAVCASASSASSEQS